MRNASATAPDGGLARRLLARGRRGLAIALLPASILPVLVLGRGIALAPEHALRVALADFAGGGR